MPGRKGHCGCASGVCSSSLGEEWWAPQATPRRVCSRRLWPRGIRASRLWAPSLGEVAELDSPGGQGIAASDLAAVARDERPGVGLLADGQAGGGVGQNKNYFTYGIPNAVADSLMGLCNERQMFREHTEWSAPQERNFELDRKSTRLNSSHKHRSRMPSSA